MASSMIRTLVPHTTLSNGRTSHRSKKNVQVFAAENGVINPTIRKEEAKVVDTVVASEQEKPMVAYCRCWRSGTFPACDGSHMHNEATGDNVGPLLVKKGD